MNSLKEGKRFHEVVIEEVISYPDGSFDLHYNKNGVCWTNTHLSRSYNVASKIVPKTGMILRFYGQGPWCRIDGIDINGVEIFYKTEEDWKREADAMLLKIAETDPHLAADLKKYA